MANVTIERTYCSIPLELAVQQKAFLAEETVEFCKQGNPLFLRRDPWLRMATCISAYGLLAFYLFTFVVFLFGINSLSKIVLFGLGTFRFKSKQQKQEDKVFSTFLSLFLAFPFPIFTLWALSLFSLLQLLNCFKSLIIFFFFSSFSFLSSFCN